VKQSVANRIIFDREGNVIQQFQGGALICIGFARLRMVCLYEKGWNSNPYAAFVRIKLKGE